MIKNNKKERAGSAARIKNYFLAVFFMLLIIISPAAVLAAQTYADTIYVWGYVGSTTVASNICYNTNTCQLTGFTQGSYCQYEGDYYVDSYSQCESGGRTDVSAISAFNINWDADSSDCTCKVGTGKWNIGFESGTSPSCCEDDAGEYKRVRTCSSGCTSDPGDDACCTTNNKCVYSSVCYNPGVCLGSLKCNAGSWEDHCTNGVQDCDETGLDCGGADCTICGGVEAAYWTDLRGQQITQADYNDYVALIAETSRAEGERVNFDLWEAEPVKCYQEQYNDLSQSNKADIVWKVKLCPDGSSHGNKFKAYMNLNPASFKESELLQVNLVENNSAPTAVISQPRNSDIFGVGENINFISGSYDPDDSISSYLWEFGDGSTGNQKNEVKSYTTGGPKKIKLTVQDSRSAVDDTQITILIDTAGNDPPAAIISAPKYNEVFSGLLITFNATESVDDITPFSSLVFRWDFDDGSYYENTGMAGAYFTKLFSTAGEHTARLTLKDSAGLSTEEERVFSIKGCKIPIDGDFEFVPIGSCSSQSKHYFCESQDIWYDTMVENCEGADSIAGTVDDCCPRGYFCPPNDPEPRACRERESSCSGFATQQECENVGCVWLEGTCIEPAGMSSCSDYATQGTCEADILGLGRVGGIGLGTEICGKTFGSYIINASSCHCEWDEGESSCKFFYNVNKIIGGDQFITCLKSFEITDCVVGKQTLTWNAKILPVDMQGNETAQEQCSSGQKEVKCGTPVSKLGFFSFVNFAAASLILALYYVFLLQGRGKKKDRK